MKGTFIPPIPLDTNWADDWKKRNASEANPRKDTTWLGALRKGERFRYENMTGVVHIPNVVGVVLDGSKEVKNWARDCPVVRVKSLKSRAVSSEPHDKPGAV